jgi:hypothetical protein
MAHRIIEDLDWAVPCARPRTIPQSRPRGAKRKGILYEAALESALRGEATRGQWWNFADSHGPGFCQTDFFLEGDRWSLILESKYTWTPEGHSQIELLYRPVVELALGKPVLGIQVCKVLTPAVPGHVVVVRDLATAIEVARSGRLCTLQWIGVGLLGVPRADGCPSGVAAIPSRV